MMAEMRLTCLYRTNFNFGAGEIFIEGATGAMKNITVIFGSNRFRLPFNLYRDSVYKLSSLDTRVVY